LDDLDAQFDAELNKNTSGFGHYLTLTNSDIATGHDICGYLGAHTYDETVQQFRLSMPTAPPTDQDTQEFVGIAINDLCPQYIQSRQQAPTPPPPPPLAPGPQSSLANIVTT
jgi:hypothetical protein